MSKKIIVFFMAILFFYSFRFAFASVVVSEIMYDLKEGSDTGREWIELYNDSSNSVDLSSYKLFEGNTNHTLTLSQGNTNLGAYGYAIVSSDPVKFKIDWPNFSGSIFDSSFSLSNTGEEIGIKDSLLNLVDSYIYNSTNGGDGDGNSLQKINNSWQGSSPTPGSSNGLSNSNSTVAMGALVSEEEMAKISNTQKVVENKKEEVKIKTNIVGKNYAFKNLPTKFEAYTTGYNKEELNYGKYFWNFGDGDSKEVRINSFNYKNNIEHIYYYPGNYVLTLEYYLNIYSDTPDAVVNTNVDVVIPDVVISKIGDKEDFFVEVDNNSKYDIDISNWSIVGLDKNFHIPKNTILENKKKIIFSPKITSLSVLDKDYLRLVDANGADIFIYGKTNNESISTDNSNNLNSKININTNTVPLEVLNKKEKVQGGFVEYDKDINLTANTTDSDVEVTKNRYIPVIIFGLLLIISGGLVYFVRSRNKKDILGNDFDILEG